jgi:hypothetical protein
MNVGASEQKMLHEYGSANSNLFKLNPIYINGENISWTQTKFE